MNEYARICLEKGKKLKQTSRLKEGEQGVTVETDCQCVEE